MLIGISGKIGSGKDTVGQIIQYLMCLETDALADHQKGFADFCLAPRSNAHQSGWEIKKFAGKLKQICSLLTGIPVADFEKPEVKSMMLGEEWAKDKSFKSIGGEGWESEGLEYTRKIPTVRWLLQQVGTEAMREAIHENVWVNALFSDYHCSKDSDRDGNCGEHTKCPSPNWIITDTRFPNECEAIKKRGGILIRINRGVWSPKAGDTVDIKVFSNWSTITYTHKDEEGLHHGVGNDGYKYKSKLIRPHGQHASETALDDYQFDYVVNNDGTIEELIDKIRVVLKEIKVI